MKSIIKKTFITLLILSVIAYLGNFFIGSNYKEPGSREMVVLLHGLGRTNAAMWLLTARMENAGYHVHRVGYSSINVSPDDMLKNITQQIDQCCKNHSQNVHFVGHSLGGLMTRAYLQNNKVPKLGKVVLLGTPNQGTKVADHFSESWLMQCLGPTVKALGTGEDSFVKTLKLPNYQVGIIAGEYKNESNEAIIPGKDDGLVSVESTKIDNMADFILIETGHSMMRYNSEVAEQTIEFIKNGLFKEKDKK